LRNSGLAKKRFIGVTPNFSAATQAMSGAAAL